MFNLFFEEIMSPVFTTKTYEKVEDFIGLSHFKQYEALNEFASVVCKELNIPVPRIVVQMNMHGCCFHDYYYTVELNPYQLDMSRSSPLMVLAHELRHAWQFYTKRLASCFVRVNHGMIVGQLHVNTWNGVPWRGPTHIHHILPWEIDAIEYEEAVAARINVKPFKRDDREQDVARFGSLEKAIAHYCPSSIPEHLKQSA